MSLVTATEFIQDKLKNVRQVGGIVINIVCTSKIQSLHERTYCALVYITSV
jgi:hypothetical protein